MNTFPMTELVIDVLDAEDLTQGKAVAQKIVALAKDGNASLLRVLWDRVDPAPSRNEQDEQITDEERIVKMLELLETARARSAGPAPQ